MRLSLFLGTLAALIMAACIVFAQVDKGAEHMNLEGGVQGTVPFPHHQHQVLLNDCLVCHSYFNQEKRGIAKGIEEGRLTSKQVMNSLCIQCHRTEKKSGRKSGPLSCATCHIKG